MLLKENYKLYDYQQEIVDWMSKISSRSFYGSSGGVLFVEMGLGKTFTTLEYIRQKGLKKSLIICSKSLIQEWISQINKFYEKKPKLLVLHNDYTKLKNITKKDLMDSDIVITTYHMISRANKISKGKKVSDTYFYKIERSMYIDYKVQKVKEELKGIHSLYNIEWDIVVSDECQTLSSWRTEFYKSVYSIKRKSFFGLSGTPIKNNRDELISLLKLIGIRYFCEPKNWSREHILPNMFKLFKEVKFEDTDRKLPQLNMMNIELDLDLKSKQLYQTYYDKLKKLFYISKNLNGRDRMIIMGLFTRLRQICLDPCILQDTEIGMEQYLEFIDDENNQEEELIFDNPKYTKIKEILKLIENRKEKVIIFSTFTSYLKRLSNDLKNNSIENTILLSKYSIKQRQKLIEDWKTSKTNNILIMNYKIGSEGLNLTESNNIILTDTWWNYTYEQQAIARSRRMGQEKEVNVYRLTTRDTIESLLINKCKMKEGIFDKIRQGIDLKELDIKISKGNLEYLIKKMFGIEDLEGDYKKVMKSNKKSNKKSNIEIKSNIDDIRMKRLQRFGKV